MSYIPRAEEELRRLLEATVLEPDQIEPIVSFVRQKIAESYKNGIEAQERVRQAKRATSR